MLKLTTHLKMFAKKICFSSKILQSSNQIFETDDLQVLDMLSKYMIVKEDFLSESDEINLLNEIEPYMKKLRYEFDHWDNV